jgi:hypothetical protein
MDLLGLIKAVSAHAVILSTDYDLNDYGKNGGASPKALHTVVFGPQGT